jgi:hypothetical protein
VLAPGNGSAPAAWSRITYGFTTKSAAEKAAVANVGITRTVESRYLVMCGDDPCD